MGASRGCKTAVFIMVNIIVIFYYTFSFHSSFITILRYASIKGMAFFVFPLQMFIDME